jgi:DNA-binding LacI/PurR family transcriptional regulator/DNA-binding transcriptional regulator YhcF (GntR family)
MSFNVLEKSKTYQGIKKKICERLITEWQPNDRLPPIKDLAIDLGVGQSSTYQAVKELVREGILVSKPRLGTFVNNNLSTMKPKLDSLLHDQPYMAKLPLANKRIQLLTYRSIFQRHTFFTQAVDSFNETITKAGGEIFTTFIDDPNTRSIEPFINADAHGIVVFNPSNLMHIECNPDQIITIITPSRECALTMTERFDLIAVDDIQGSTLAGEYCRKLGYSEVCFVGVKRLPHQDRYDQISAKRLEGFCLGLKSPIRLEWQFSCDSYGSFDATQAVKKWMELSPRPSTVFAASDDLAYGFIHGAMAYGLFPGKDFQIIGFDAQFEGPYCKDWVLTSISIPIAEMGTAGARAMMTRLENPTMTPQRLYLGCKLFVGNSMVKAT